MIEWVKETISFWLSRNDRVLDGWLAGWLAGRYLTSCRYQSRPAPAPVPGAERRRRAAVATDDDDDAERSSSSFVRSLKPLLLPSFLAVIGSYRR